MPQRRAIHTKGSATDGGVGSQGAVHLAPGSLSAPRLPPGPARPPRGPRPSSHDTRGRHGGWGAGGCGEGHRRHAAARLGATQPAPEGRTGRGRDARHRVPGRGLPRAALAGRPGPRVLLERPRPRPQPAGPPLGPLQHHRVAQRPRHARAARRPQRARPRQLLLAPPPCGTPTPLPDPAPHLPILRPLAAAPARQLPAPGAAPAPRVPRLSPAHPAPLLAFSYGGGRVRRVEGP